MLSIRLPQKNLTFSQLFLGDPGISLSWILLAVRFSCTSFQKCWRTFFTSAFAHIGAFRKLTFAPCYASFCQNLWFCAKWVLLEGKIRSLEIPSGSLILNSAFETLKRFQSLRQSFALAHFVRFHLTFVLRNFASLWLTLFFRLSNQRFVHSASFLTSLHNGGYQ